MNTIKKTLIKTGLTALLVGTTLLYSCNNSNNNKKMSSNVSGTMDKKPPSAQRTKKVYSKDFLFTADYLGNRDRIASEEEIQDLENLIAGAKQYGMHYIYQDFVKEYSGRTHRLGPITVGNKPLEINPATLKYTDATGQKWKESEFYGHYGKYEIDTTGIIHAKYTLIKGGFEGHVVIPYY